MPTDSRVSATPQTWDERAVLTTCSGDADFTVALDVPLARLLDDYGEQSERLRARVAAHELDETAARALPDGRRPVLRWILAHLIEEISLHNGQVDPPCELADGRTRR